jgi:peptidoglycan/LPS O-acetylase OafA/YrhL
VFFHLGYGSWAKPTSRAAQYLATDFTMPTIGWLGFAGWVGVQIFFVVSGVVITQSANGRSPMEFVKGRMYRLYPAVWICATITILAALPYGVLKEPLEAYLHSMTLLPAPPWVDVQYWTLQYEMFFYGLVFLLLLGRSFEHIEKLALGLIALAATSWLALYAVESANHSIAETLREKLMGSNSHGLPFFYGSFFGLGILIALWSNGRISRAGLVGVGIALAVSCWQIYDTHLDEAPKGTDFPVLLATYWPVPIGIFLVSVAAINLSTTDRWTVSDQSGGIMRTLGLATYPLYLIHLTSGALLMKWLMKYGMWPSAAFTATVLIVVAISIFIAVVLETRVRRAFRWAVEWVEDRLPRPARLYSPGGVI